MKELNTAEKKDDSDEEEESNGLGSFEEDYAVYQNSGETFASLL